MFSGGQYGPDAQIDTLGNALSGAVVTVPDGYVSALDALGNLTITGPATDALTYTITPVGRTPIARTVRVEPLVSELDSLLGGGGGGGGDSTHAGAGTGSTAVGASAVASADRTASLGFQAQATAYEGTAMGWNALATVQYGTAVGADSWARSDYGTAVGAESTAHGLRSGAFGYGAVENADDACMMRFDSVEVQASSALNAPTSIILADATGQRWKITVDTTGHLTTVAL